MRLHPWEISNVNHMYALSYNTCIDGKERDIRVKLPYKGRGVLKRDRGIGRHGMNAAGEETTMRAPVPGGF